MYKIYKHYAASNRIDYNKVLSLILYRYWCMLDTGDAIDRMTFVECLNDLLSAENTVVERLGKSILETPLQESKRKLQQQLKEQHKQQSRLENLIAYYGGNPTNSKADLVPLDNSVDATTKNDMIKKNN